MPVVKGQLRGTEDIHPLTGARGGTNLIPIRSPVRTSSSE